MTCQVGVCYCLSVKIYMHKQEDCGCILFIGMVSVYVVNKNQNAYNWSSIADDAITRDGILVLVSLLYICGSNRVNNVTTFFFEETDENKLSVLSFCYKLFDGNNCVILKCSLVFYSQCMSLCLTVYNSSIVNFQECKVSYTVKFV